MSLKQKLQEDLKSSMKNKDNTKKSVVTLIRASIKQFEVDNRVELDDSQVIDIIAKLLKQTKDSLNEFKRRRTKRNRDCNYIRSWSYFNERYEANYVINHA